MPGHAVGSLQMVGQKKSRQIEIVGTPFERNLACVLAQCRRSNMHDGGGMLL